MTTNPPTSQASTANLMRELSIRAPDEISRARLSGSTSFSTGLEVAALFVDKKDSLVLPEEPSE
jgi:hypothetical protein